MAGSLTGGGQGPITGPPILSGDGPPEGVVGAMPGALYRELGDAATLHLKETGAGTKTGWVYIADQTLGAVPTGTILDFAGATEPDGFLLCYGQSVLRADYADLFVVIGTAYGSVDGTHFTIPDCRGYVMAGKEDMGGAHKPFGPNNLTYQTTASITNGSAAFNVTVPGDIMPYFARNMFVLGTGVTVGTYITTLNSSTNCTLSANATATISGGSFRVGFLDAERLGSKGGYPSYRLSVSEIPAHSHLWNYPYNTAAGIAGGSNYNQNPTPNQSTSLVGGDNAHINMQPTMISNKIIKT